MKATIKILSDKIKMIDPQRFQKNIFSIFAQKSLVIETADIEKINTELLVDLPENYSAYLTTKFKNQTIKEFIGPCKKRLWIEILNSSYLNKLNIKKGDLIGCLLFEPNENVNVFYIRKKKPNYSQKKKDVQIIIYPKTDRKNINLFSKKRKTKKGQVGGFLNKYDFAYAGRDTVNQVGKIAPKIITQATGEINKIAQDRIDQIIRSGGAEVKCIIPKIIRGVIEEVYKTPFRMLGNFGKEQFQKIK